MRRTSVFQSNRSQTVRLPKDVAFPDGVRVAWSWRTVSVGARDSQPDGSWSFMLKIETIGPVRSGTNRSCNRLDACAVSE
jgi:hypothetical protein